MENSGLYNDAQILMAGLMQETMFKPAMPKDKYIAFWQWMSEKMKKAHTPQAEYQTVIDGINFLDSKFPDLKISEKLMQK